MEFPLSVQRGLFVTREIKAQGREKGLSGDMPRTVPLRTGSIGNLFWGLSPLLPLKESSVKRMKINLILLSRSGWREPQPDTGKQRLVSLPVTLSFLHLHSTLLKPYGSLLPPCLPSPQAAHSAAATASPFHKVERAMEANSLSQYKAKD